MRVLARYVMNERQGFSHLRDELSLFVQLFILMSHAVPANIMPFSHRALHIALPALTFQIGSLHKKSGLDAVPLQNVQKLPGQFARTVVKG